MAALFWVLAFIGTSGAVFGNIRAAALTRLDRHPTDPRVKYCSYFAIDVLQLEAQKVQKVSSLPLDYCQ